MADPAQSTIDILIDIRAKLDELTRGQTAMRGLAEDTRDANREANNLTASFKTGLGIEVARRGIELLTGSLRESAAFAARLSDEIERAGVRAGLSGEVYQALGFHLKQAGGSAEELVASLEFLRRTLGEASDPKSGPAKTLNEIGLSFRQLKGLAVEDQFERIARALSKVTDENRRARLTADLLGRGSASLNDLLEQLARRGLGELRSEAEKASGVIKNDLARALDTAGDRAEAARSRFQKVFAPIAAGAKDAEADIAEMKANLADVLVNSPGTVAATIGVTGAAAAAAAVVKAGGLGSPQAWGMLAGVNLARASALAVPAWMAVGTIIAAAVGAAFVTGKYALGAMKAVDQREATERAEDTRRRDLSVSLSEARDPAAVARVQAEATRMSRRFSRDAALAEGDERTRLETISRAYSVIVAQARTHGAEIIANNKKLDEQRAILAAIPKTWDELTEKEQKAAQDRSELIERDVKVFAQQLAISLKNERSLREQAQARKLKAEEDAKALTVAEREAALVVANAKADALEAEASRISARDDIDAATKQAKIAELYDRIRSALADIIALKKTELSLTAETDPVKRAQLKADIAALDVKKATLGSGDPKTGIEGYRERARSRLGGPTAISAGEGIEAGALNFVAELGSQGEQIASALQKSIGATVQGISDGIWGWITGAATFGETMRNLVGTVLRTALDTVVQIGVQQVVNAMLGKQSMLGMHLFGEGLRAQRVDATAAEGAATTTAMAPGAAAASISSFGMAAIIGIAALLAAMAAFGGFAKGGYTGDGAVGEVAGLAHRGEDVWSQADIARMGGLDNVEALRTGGLDALPVPPPVQAMAVHAPKPLAGAAALAANGGNSQAKSGKYFLVMCPTKEIYEDMKRRPEYEADHVDIIYRRRGDLF